MEQRNRGNYDAPLSHFVKLTTQLNGSASVWDSENHFMYTVDLDGEPLTPDKRFHYTSGVHEPFVGYTTRTGTVEPKIHFLEKDILLTKLKNILDIVSWTDTTTMNPDGTLRVSNVRAYVERVLRLYTNRPLSDFAPFSAARKSGTFTHHGRAPGFRESIIPNTLSNVYQHFYGTTDTHLTLQRAKDDHYCINFLQIYCHVAMLSFQELDFTKNVTTPYQVWGVTVDCDHCMEPIIEKPMILNLRHVPLKLVNPLSTTTLDRTATEILRESMISFTQKEFNLYGVETDISIDIAVKGILQELCEASLRQTERIQARYTQHSMNADTYRILKHLVPQSSARDISMTELKMIDTEEYIQPVTQIVGYLFHKLVGQTYGYGVLSKCQSIPPRDLPWYALVAVLHKVGKLSGIIERITKILNMPPIHNFQTVDTVCAYFGYVCCQYIFDITHDNYMIVVVSNMNLGDIAHFIRVDLSVIIWSVLASNVKDMTVWEGKSREQTHLIMAGLMIAAIYADRYEVRNEDVENVSHTDEEMFISNLLPFNDDDLSDDILDDILSEEYFKGNSPMFKRLLYFAKWHRFAWSKILTDNYEEACAFAVNLFDRTKLRVCVTTLPNCITTIRNREIPAPDVTPRFRQHFNPPLTINPKIETKCLWTSIKHMGTMPVSRTLEVAIASVNEGLTDVRHYENWETIHNVEPYLHRSVGDQNASMSHLLNIYHELKFPTRIGLLISCLGDGYGGMTTGMSILHNESYIQYNTRPNPETLVTKPNMAINLSKDTRAVINSDLLSTHVFDLSKSSTIDALVRHWTANHIVTSDTETDVDDPVTHSLIMTHVVNYYFRTRTQDGLLIMKIYLPHVSQNLKILTRLAYSCQHIGIIQPLSIRCLNTAYIIAIGTIAGWEKIWENDITNIPIPVITMYKQFTSHVKRVVDIKLRFNYTIDPTTLIKRVVVDELWPSYGLAMALLHVGIAVTTYDITSRTTLENKCKELLSQYRYPQVIRPYRDEIVDGRMRPVVNQIWDPNTRARRDQMICKWFRIWGFHATLTRLSESCKRLITRAWLQQTYKKLFAELPLRDYNPLHRYERLYQSGNTHQDGSPMPYYDNFMMGVAIALSVLSYLSLKHPLRAVLYNAEIPELEQPLQEE